MMSITPLLMSEETDHYKQQFRCVGIFEHTINFQSEADGALLSLHRYGTGLSPFGWIIRRDDFDEMRDVVSLHDVVMLTSNYLYHRGFVVVRSARKISPVIPQAVDTKVSFTTLQSILLQCSGETGLFGSLSQIVASPLIGELLDVQRGYIQWLDHLPVDWRPYIGKGAGLTPSFDDTLVGMLFIAHLDSRASLAYGAPAKLGQTFLSDSVSQQLPQLTTYVSVAYYQSALKGAFSSPLLSLAYALQSNQQPKIERAIHQISLLGHTSGLDTLLGIWLAVHALDSASNYG